ncbi:MAG: dynamin family protein [Paraclostridium sp.]
MNNRNRDKEYLNIKEKLCNIEENISKVKLQCFNYKSYTLDFIQKIDEEIKSNSKSIEELKSPFLLFIIGPGKYGKTTLINSLIQDKLLEINDIPNTWKLDVLQKSNKKRIEIYYSDGSCKEVLYNDGIKIVQEEEQKYKSSKKLIKKQFDDYKIHNKKNIQELKQYKQELENKNLYISNIEEVKFYINKSKILEDFIIVDTPGLNQTLKKNTKNRMLNYYKRADGVIWIIDAQNVVSTCSKDLLKELKINYMLEENFNNVICVVNKIDCIKKEDREKIFYKVNELYKSNFKDVVLVSSKQALNGYLSKDITLINSSNICSLIKSIDKNFKNHSEEIQIKSKYNNLKITSIKINNYIDIYKRHLYSDIHKYEESKRTVEEELEKLKNELEIKVNRYISINNLEDKNI